MIVLNYFNMCRFIKRNIFKFKKRELSKLYFEWEKVYAIRLFCLTDKIVIHSNLDYFDSENLTRFLMQSSKSYNQLYVDLIGSCA